MRTLALVVAVVAAAAALLALGALTVTLPGPANVDVASPPPLEELRAQLDEERQAREQLALRVRALDSRIAALGVEPGSASRDPESEPDALLEGVVVDPAIGTAAEAEPSAALRGSFDADSLRAAGLSRGEVEWLRGRWERGQLEALYLTDRALRGRWGMGRLRSERQRQRDALIEEIGTGMYDLMQYATGRDNRVVVRDVYAGSAGEASDLRPGDVIVAYAGVPIFQPRDLRWISSRGEPGLLVTIQVRRGGRIEDLRIERGPLGVSTERQRERPPLP